MHTPAVPARLHAPQIGRLGIPDRDAAHTLQRHPLSVYLAIHHSLLSSLCCFFCYKVVPLPGKRCPRSKKENPAVREKNKPKTDRGHRLYRFHFG